MAIKQMLHTTELCNKIISIISAALKTSLNLKEIQFGGLEYLPTPTAATFANYVPGILVKPLTIDPKFKELGESYEMNYSFRIIFINKFSISTEVVKEKALRIKDVAELFFDDLTLGALALTNGTINWLMIDKIEFEPPEDDFVLTFGSNLYAIALNLTINVLTES